MITLIAKLLNALVWNTIPLQDFDYGEDLRGFKAHFKSIQGPRYHPIKGGVNWLEFVFKRWFLIANFLDAQEIEAFWHFDSDTTLLTDLEPHEMHFAGYAATEQCNGSCINGYISNRSVVRHYVQRIVQIFQRDDVLRNMQQEFDSKHPGRAFTEMGAWDIFREEDKLPTTRLNLVRDGTSFDDVVRQDHGMITEKIAIDGSLKKVKKVFLAPRGRFFCIRKLDKLPVQMLSLNLSWLPVEVFAKVWAHLKKSKAKLRIPTRPLKLKHYPTLAAIRLPLRYRILQTISGSLKAKNLTTAKNCSDSETCPPSCSTHRS